MTKKVTKKTIVLGALVGVLLATATAFALTGTKGYADRIALREGYSQYEGKIDLRDSTGAVIFYFWGGSRCAGAPVAPTDRQVDVLLNAHLHGHEASARLQQRRKLVRHEPVLGRRNPGLLNGVPGGTPVCAPPAWEAAASRRFFRHD